MKICFLIDSLRFGGAQKVTRDLVTELSRCNNVDVELITYFDRFEIGDPKTFNHKKVKVFCLSRISIFSYVDAILYKIFGKFYQYVMSYFYTRSLIHQSNILSFDKIFLVSDSGFFPFFHLKFYHPDVSYIIHSIKSKQYLNSKVSILNYFKRMMITRVFNGVKLITVSDGIRDDLLKNFNVEKTKVHTIYNLLALDEIIYKSRCIIESSLYNKEMLGEYICHVGRHSKEKRIDILLESYRNLRDLGLQHKLLLVGDGPEKKKLESIVTKLGLKNKVIFIGFLSNPYPIIKSAKCLILSSEREGLPTVLLEALLLGTPVVSTNCNSGPSEILKGDLSRFLCDVNSVESLSCKIQQALFNEYGGIEFPSDFLNEKIMADWLRLLNDRI